MRWEVVETSSDNVVVPIFRRVPLIRLTERTCKWPLGDPLKEDFCFCGNDSPGHLAYCTFHQRLPTSRLRNVAGSLELRKAQLSCKKAARGPLLSFHSDYLRIFGRRGSCPSISPIAFLSLPL